eukprot:CAMPEP_0113870100 /NCGR_PEP_ID=MMETSP0780_2-20120614/1896_1 /TAXON_ID=652834 /ORGANISM="Palpitomonas bilix" /LENGTH=303 /DNA_ID=CAMNT_0000855335 /DNA_START=469 /DNA_END=1380 /DNA_ORIENTATION=- /assembly_acc=CAM_ASM_000599
MKLPPVHAWRGYFPVGDEYTNGRPDLKEGLYMGGEEDPDCGLPMHGLNRFPEGSPLSKLVPEYLKCIERVAFRVLGLLSLTLGLEEGFLEGQFGGKPPFTPFRAFNYPPTARAAEYLGDEVAKEVGDQLFSVGKHTDYGLLTFLWQDRSGGLEVMREGRWTAAPPTPVEGMSEYDHLVVNIGDMLELWTKGEYKATPHRVRRHPDSAGDRLSIPYFFDPPFHAKINPLPTIPGQSIGESGDEAYAHPSGVTLPIVYGNYILLKVARVFPDLAHTASILDGQEQGDVTKLSSFEDTIREEERVR